MGNLATPKSVQKLQTALHAKAKAEPGFRFYALYDKIYREDILAYAYAQCRSNQGAPGVDGQEFADVEAYGVQRWLGELALALREETYRPEPIRRVFIPKAKGKLRPLGISTLRDRVCMTAALLVLEPIFEGWVRVFLGQPEVAIEHLTTALRLSPFDPLAFKMHAATAYANFFGERYDEASISAEHALRARPNYLTAARGAAASHAFAGRLNEAQRLIAQVRERDSALRISNLKDLIPLRRAGDLDRLAEGLQKAGLPG